VIISFVVVVEMILTYVYTLPFCFRQGEKWHMLRSVLTPELTSAKTIQQFLPELNQVIEDFVSFLRTTRDKNGVISGFEELTNRMGLESEFIFPS
jgi:hypothetical protein